MNSRITEWNGNFKVGDLLKYTPYSRPDAFYCILIEKNYDDEMKLYWITCATQVTGLIQTVNYPSLYGEYEKVQ